MLSSCSMRAFRISLSSLRTVLSVLAFCPCARMSGRLLLAFVLDHPPDALLVDLSQVVALAPLAFEFDADPAEFFAHLTDVDGDDLVEGNVVGPVEVHRLHRHGSIDDLPLHEQAEQLGLAWRELQRRREKETLGGAEHALELRDLLGQRLVFLAQPRADACRRCLRAPYRVPGRRGGGAAA